MNASVLTKHKGDKESDYVSRPGARFSKVPKIDGPVKLLLFTCKIEVSIVLHLT